MAIKGSGADESRRRNAPSGTPMSGVDDRTIDTGATSGAQLPSGTDRDDDRNKEQSQKRAPLNPNQGDLPGPFWPRK
ncbi:MAG TPA: hypothetical protein VGE12_22040 [Noviherbaspirillum sp.]